MQFLVLVALARPALPWGVGPTHPSIGAKLVEEQVLTPRLLPDDLPRFVRATMCPDMISTAPFKAAGITYVHTLEFAEILRSLVATDPRFMTGAHRATAYAWGVHLAADGVAHETYVPADARHPQVETEVDTVIYYDRATYPLPVGFANWEATAVHPDDCSPDLVTAAAEVYLQTHGGSPISPALVEQATQGIAAWLDTEFTQIRLEQDEHSSETDLEGQGLWPFTVPYAQAVLAAACWITRDAPPATPAPLVAVAVSPSQITLRWTVSSCDGTMVRIERRTAAGSYSQMAQPEATTSPYADTGLDPATTYVYRARMCNAVGCSDYSDEVSATTLPTPLVVTSVTLTGGGALLAGGTPVSVTWRAAGTTPETTYTVYLSTDGGATFPTVLATGLPGTMHSLIWTPTSAQLTTRARLRVVGQDGQGGQTAQSETVDSVTVATPDGYAGAHLAAPLHRVSLGPGRKRAPALAFDPSTNQFVAVWLEGTGALCDAGAACHIVGQALSASAAPPPGGADILVSGASAVVGRPAIENDPLGHQCLVVWVEDAGGVRSVAGRFVGADGSLPAPSFSIAPGTTTGAEAFPALAVDTNLHQFLVVWADDRNGSKGVYGRLLGPDGSFLGPIVPIAVGIQGQTRPAVAFSPLTGRFFVVWGEDQAADTGTRIVGRLVNADGNVDPAGNLVIASGPSRKAAPAVDFNPVAARYLVAWEDDRSGSPDIFGQVLTDAGIPPAGATAFAITSGVGEKLAVAVRAIPVSPQFFLAWEDRQARTIAGRLVHGSGTQGSIYSIAPATGDVRSPSLAFNADDLTTVILWSTDPTETVAWTVPRTIWLRLAGVVRGIVRGVAAAEAQGAMATDVMAQVLAFELPSAAPATEASGGGGGGGGGCFIATAAYGSPLAPQVLLLREFRDRYLLSSAAGQAAVGWYYALSPSWANVIAQSALLRSAVRLALIPVLGGVAMILWSPWLGVGVLLSGIAVGIWLIRKT